MVLGSDPDVDVAVLQVDHPDLIADIGALTLRDPVAADKGRPVYLVGYPSAGPLTLSSGGIVTRVWDDAIQTTSSAFGGNSGGPLLDACGDVLGVLWAGSWSDNFFPYQQRDSPRSRCPEVGEAPLPADVPDVLQSPGTVIWHYAAEPPADVDCAGGGRRLADWPTRRGS